MLSKPTTQHNAARLSRAHQASSPPNVRDSGKSEAENVAMWLIVILLIARVSGWKLESRGASQQARRRRICVRLNARCYSIIASLVIGQRYPVYWLVLASPAFALVSATATGLSGSGFWGCTASAFACVATMQVAYMVVTWLHVGSEPSPRGHDRVGNIRGDIDDPLTARRRAAGRLDNYDLQLLSLGRHVDVGGHDSD
jgi:hypothetical protein